MRIRAFLAAVVVLAMATSAQAISLVVMATNSAPGVAGAKAYTIGVKVTAADVAAGGANPVLFVQNVTFTGNGINPVNTANTKAPNANVPDVQTLQTSFVDTNLDAPPDNAGMSANGIKAMYQDSWWYNSSTGNGLLQGVVDSAGDPGIVTTNPAGDGSGVYALGPIAAVGTTGYTFFPSGAPGIVPANATAGQTMTYSGLFGPTGADFWNPSAGGPFTDPNHILGDLLVANGGSLTVALAQIVSKGNINVPSAINGGAGTFLEMGTPIYNVLGGPVAQDPGAFLDYGNNVIRSPEPGSIVLAGLGVLGLALAWRRRK